MYQTLQLNPRFYIQSTIGLTCLSILEKKFYDAQQYIMKIDERRLIQKKKCYYNIFNVYIKYFLGQLKLSDNIYDPIKDYMIYLIKAMKHYYFISKNIKINLKKQQKVVSLNILIQKNYC